MVQSEEVVVVLAEPLLVNRFSQLEQDADGEGWTVVIDGCSEGQEGMEEEEEEVVLLLQWVEVHRCFQFQLVAEG